MGNCLACKDTATDCSKYINAECKMSAYQALMATKCRKTCGFCNVCLDANARCELVAVD